MWQARINLNLTPFLSLITLHNVVNSEIRVSYVVAIHIWFFICMLFTFLGLVEFFMCMGADHMAKIRQKEKREEPAEAARQRDGIEMVIMMPQHQHVYRSHDLVSESGTRHSLWSKITDWIKLTGKQTWRQRRHSNVNPVDAVARFLAPSGFFCVALIYFLYFCNYHD